MKRGSQKRTSMILIAVGLLMLSMIATEKLIEAPPVLVGLSRWSLMVLPFFISNAGCGCTPKNK